VTFIGEPSLTDVNRAVGRLLAAEGEMRSAQREEREARIVLRDATSEHQEALQELAALRLGWDAVLERVRQELHGARELDRREQR
jgi:hypothetical protein